MKRLEIIGAAQGWGGRRSGTERAPDTLQAAGLAETLGATWRTTFYPEKWAYDGNKSQEDTLPIIWRMAQEVGEEVKKSVQEGALPLVIGGDHSVAMGTWAGVTAGLGCEGDFGLVWFDAHMDAHTPQTRHEGKWGGHYHGQPLACLMGYGEQELIHILSSQVKLNPKHIALVGIRSYEPGEEALLKKLGVRIYKMDEIHQKGFDAVFAEAVDHASQAGGGFGLSVDMDGFDAQDAPGVGTAEKNGVKGEEMCAAIRGLARHKKLKALEVVEFNPERDQQQKTQHLLEKMLIACQQEEA